MGAERRRHPRVLAAQPLEAYVIGTDILVRIVDVSTGGLGGVSQSPLAVGRPLTCEIRSNGVGLIRIAAKTVYCRPRAGQKGLFDVGFAFLDAAHACTQATVGALMEHVTSVLQFDDPAAH